MAKSVKKKGKKKGGEDLINIPPPTPQAVQPESEGGPPGVMIEYTCHWEQCNLPDKKFTRIKKGGRAPMYCCDAHRNAANYAKNGPPGSGGTRTSMDKKLLELFFKEATLTVNKKGTRAKIEVTEFDIPENLIPVLAQAITRSNNDTPQ